MSGLTWGIDVAAPVYSGRFSVYPGNGIDAVTGTDGIAAMGGQVGPYTNGVVVMQDDSDTDEETPTSPRVPLPEYGAVLAPAARAGARGGIRALARAGRRRRALV